MTNENDEKKKQVIGLYGEMQLAMALHNKGWQVHRSYIDEGIDFVITKYWCSSCKKFTHQYIKKEKYKGKDKNCVTNLCKMCKKNGIKIISKYLQVKTSEGIATKNITIREFSFHPKIRYDMGKDVFYIWIAVFNDTPNILNTPIVHFYIFNTKYVTLFDDIKIDTYQITDNQKTTLTINAKGVILNEGKKYKYDCFNKFHNDFKCLEQNAN